MAGELDCGEGLAKTFERIKDSKGRTALHLAAAGGKTHICKYFIEHLKLDVNLKDENGILRINCSFLFTTTSYTISILGTNYRYLFVFKYIKCYMFIHTRDF